MVLQQWHFLFPKEERGCYMVGSLDCSSEYLLSAGSYSLSALGVLWKFQPCPLSKAGIDTSCPEKWSFEGEGCWVLTVGRQPFQELQGP